MGHIVTRSFGGGGYRIGHIVTKVRLVESVVNLATGSFSGGIIKWATM